MAGSRSLRTADVCAALAQVAAGLAAHTAAAGCLPSTSTLLLALPTAVAALLIVGRALPGRPLRALAVGQLSVHGVLALTGCVAHGGHLHAEHPPAMVLGHVAAIVLSRAVLDQVVASADRAAAALRALVVRWLRRPEPVQVVTPVLAVPVAPVLPRRPDLLAAVRRRGPPAGAVRGLPA
jgi:hypothetical protein